MSSSIDIDYSVALEQEQGWQQQKWAEKANKLKAKHLPSTISPTPLWGANETYFKINQKQTDEAAMRALEQNYATALQDLEKAQKEISTLKTNSVARLNKKLSEELEGVVKKNNKLFNVIVLLKNNTGIIEEKINKTLKELEDKSIETETAEQHLNSLDSDFKNLDESYNRSKRKMQNIIKTSEEILKKSTFAPVAEKQQMEMKMQFAAKIGLSMEAVDYYETEFEQSLKNCQAAFSKSKEAFNNIGASLVNLKNLLNSLDHQIAVAKSPDSWNLSSRLVYWGKKTRTFVPEKV